MEPTEHDRAPEAQEAQEAPEAPEAPHAAQDAAGQAPWEQEQTEAGRAY